MSSYVTNFIVASNTGHLFDKNYVNYLTALINRNLVNVFNSAQMGAIAYCIGQKINSLINLYGQCIYKEGNMGSTRTYFEK